MAKHRFSLARSTYTDRSHHGLLYACACIAKQIFTISLSMHLRGFEQRSTSCTSQAAAEHDIEFVTQLSPSSEVCSSTSFDWMSMALSGPLLGPPI